MKLLKILMLGCALIGSVATSQAQTNGDSGATGADYSYSFHGTAGVRYNQESSDNGYSKFGMKITAENINFGTDSFSIKPYIAGYSRADVFAAGAEYAGISLNGGLEMIAGNEAVSLVGRGYFGYNNVSTDTRRITDSGFGFAAGLSFGLGGEKDKFDITYEGYSGNSTFTSSYYSGSLTQAVYDGGIGFQYRIAL